MQDNDAVEVVDFPPPKSVIQLLREALGDQPPGFGVLSAVAELMEPHSASTAANPVLAPFLWYAMSERMRRQGDTALPSTLHSIRQGSNGLQMLHAGSVLAGASALSGQNRGVQMLYNPTIVH